MGLKIAQKKVQCKKMGLLYVISAPSGAGKTTLCRKLLNKSSALKLSVSYTTRSPRKGEENDIDYTFISERKFKGMINRGEFAEWAEVHGNLYGTSIKRLKKLNREGYDIILDIDVNGAMQLKKTCDDAVFIFVLPPSFRTLKKRLVNRNTDSKEIVEIRLKNAKSEITAYDNYQYVVINDDLQQACGDLESIIRASRLKTDNLDKKWISGFLVE